MLPAFTNDFHPAGRAFPTHDTGAEKMATQRAETAVVAALAPICVERFQQQTDAAAKLVAFNKVSASWDRRSLIEKGGWATMPGNSTPNSAVASACAEKLGSLT
jgi:hypothetical protein